jgi:hypothetical protein
LGHLLDGEQSGCAEPVVAAGQLVGLAEPDPDDPGWCTAGSGAVAGPVELFGGLGIGVVVREPVEQGHGGCGGLVGLQALGGIGIVRLVSWPPRIRTCRWI